MDAPVNAARTAPTSSASLCALHDAGSCRSCPYLAVPLPAQLERKQTRIAALLADGASPVPAAAWQPPVASAPERFRNKAKMVVTGSVAHPVLGVLGPDRRGVDLRTCPLHVPEIEAALPVLARTITELSLTPYDVSRRRGELKYVLVTASPDGDLMVRFVLRSHRHVDALRSALPRLQRALPTLAVLSVNIQPVHQAIIEGPEEIVLTREDRLLMRLHLPELAASTKDAPAAGELRAETRELPLYLPTRSFFQTNTAIAERLYATARRWADEALAVPGAASTAPQTPLQVWDLFCGVGGFALALAGPGRRVLGVEVSAPAIAGARAAARLMRLDDRQVRFESGDASVLDPGSGPAPDLLVVNPPRRGIGAELAERIERSGVQHVLYSSCNPTSLATDLARMPSLEPYRARLFDMFPHTDHAEVLVALRRSPGSVRRPDADRARMN
ncbi:methyltransferase domain-containing protein [Actinomyces sp. MRS3W]|uniref:methyltransferase domain-containing protein n=1 Tax=Actinomyces sp. MRS3W TaxID=2800796 RepID=UPI0028FD3956|nr:methyltransferase domain-containing protein [Actinomyces sp. MRS3W]MDU0349653.1 methyltransferase domain-containing protein [Actinomyces sp. MRS3W]